MKTETNYTIVEIKSFKEAKILSVKEKPSTLVIEAKTNYIPIDQFREIFVEAGKLIKELGIRKLVFDKRTLTVFHQPSMEWYFVVWKDQMFDLGLRSHVKILPNDKVFKQSVAIGRQKINDAYPNGKFHQMDIKYADTLEEAIELD